MVIFIDGNTKNDVASEFALSITRSLIDFVHEQYDKYKNR